MPEKGGGLGQSADLGGGGRLARKREGGVFEGGLIPQCTLYYNTIVLMPYLSPEEELLRSICKK